MVMLVLLCWVVILFSQLCNTLQHVIAVLAAVLQAYSSVKSGLSPAESVSCFPPKACLLKG